MTFLAQGGWRLGVIVFLASTPWLSATPANQAAVAYMAKTSPCKGSGSPTGLPVAASHHATVPS